MFLCQTVGRVIVRDIIFVSCILFSWLRDEVSLT